MEEQDRYLVLKQRTSMDREVYSLIVEMTVEIKQLQARIFELEASEERFVDVCNELIVVLEFDAYYERFCSGLGQWEFSRASRPEQALARIREVLAARPKKE